MYDDLINDIWGHAEEREGPSWSLAKTAITQRRDGDLRAAITTLEEALVLAQSDEAFSTANLVLFLLGKAAWLAEDMRANEALAVSSRGSDVAEIEGLLVWQAWSGVVRGAVLEESRHRREALAAFSRVVASVGESEPDYKLRAIAARALAFTTGELIRLGQITEALESWKVLLERFRNEGDVGVQIAVVRGCYFIVNDFTRRKNWKVVIALNEQIIDRYRDSEVPVIRGFVAVAMASRMAALRSRLRPIAAIRASDEFMAYVTPYPEPQVAETVRLALKGGDALLRHAQKIHR